MESVDDPDASTFLMKNGEGPENDPDQTTTKSSLNADHLVPLVLQDITLSMKARRQRKRQCLFFHIVSGGNVDVVDRILTFLEEDNHHSELNWVLNRKEEDSPSVPMSIFRRFWQTIILIFTFIFFVVSTPIFYGLHAFAMGISASFRVPISDDPKLPLVFVMYSKNKDMMRLFYERGVKLSDTDGDNNNIYHYLSDLSLSNPEEAVVYHKLLMECTEDENLLQRVILHDENNAGLTPLEHCVRWGSMKFAQHLLLQKGLMRETLVHVRPNSVWIDDNYLSKMNSRKYIMGVIKSNTDSSVVDRNQNNDQVPPKVPNDHNLEIAEYNLHRYEKGDILGQQSYLLHLIASRRVELMTEQDIESFLTIDFLHSWVKRKRRHFMYPCIISHILHILITVLLLLYLLHFGGDMNPFPLLESLVENYFKVSLELLVSGLEDSLSKDLNRTKVTKASGSNVPTETYRTDWADSTVSVTNYDPQMFSIDDMTLVCHNKTDTLGGMILNQCLSKAVLMVIESCEGLRLEDALQYSGVKLFIDTGGSFKSIDSSKIIAFVMEAYMLCHILLDLFHRMMYLFRNFKTTSHFPYVTSMTFTTRRFPGSYIEKQLVMFMYSLFTVYLFFCWNLEITLKSYLVNSFQTNMKSTLTGIHASSIGVRANIDEAHEISHMEDVKARLAVGVSEAEKSNFVTKEFLPLLNNSLHTMSYLLIVCLIVRFLLAIHVMRLLPGVGFFVITARKMAQHLIEFVLVFLLVAVAFATIFHFVMRDPECPAHKVEGFSSLTAGLFSTYLIALGQAEFIFFDNTNAQITFIVYTVLTILLLFNLIIAVMSTTADSLNRKTRRKVLCILETWDETLGVEATCQTMCLPFYCCFRLGKCDKCRSPKLGEKSHPRDIQKQISYVQSKV